MMEPTLTNRGELIFISDNDKGCKEMLEAHGYKVIVEPLLPKGDWYIIQQIEEN